MDFCFDCGTKNASIKIIRANTWQCIECWEKKNPTDGVDKRLERRILAWEN